MVAWSTDGWRTRTETLTRDTGLGVHAAELPAAASGSIAFTWRCVAGDGTFGEQVAIKVG